MAAQSTGTQGLEAFKTKILYEKSMNTNMDYKSDHHPPYNTFTTQINTILSIQIRLK
jgi:hypothetical protein